MADHDSQSPPEAADPLNQLVTQRVRTLRKAKGWTLEQLATMSGVSKSMLSQIERGAANPTLGVAHRIAQAFSLSLGQFVDGPSPAPQIDVVRASDAGTLVRDDEQCRVRSLSPQKLESESEFYEVTLQPGGMWEDAPRRAGASQLVTVQTGTIRVSSGPEGVDLSAGDSAQFAADLPHRLENPGDVAAVAYLVAQPPAPSRR